VNILENLNIDGVLKAAYAAGDAIMKIYDTSDFGVEMKTDDSPLTLADKAAHIEIVKYLESTDWPIISEEGIQTPFEERNNWDTLWMVDPLDGTKEFIKRNGEFTVNIALIHGGIPVFGVVYSPILKKMYYGGTALGYSELIIESNDPLRLKSKTKSQLETIDSKSSVRIVASRSHQNQDTRNFINQYENTELVSMGSSLKFMVLAEGNADVYPRYAPTMEWDTAAAHSILLGLGYDIYQVIEPNIITKKSLNYNKENLLNPYFVAY
jgi:3'(2'), 5'-bisphosphate nucleotidase